MTRCAPPLALLASLLVSVASAHAAPPADDQVREWMRQIEDRKANFGKDGQANQQAYFRMFEDWAKSLPVDDLTLVQLHALEDQRLLSFGNLRDRLDPRLARLEAGSGIDGALATILRLQLTASSPGAMKDTAAREREAARLLDHPALPEVVKGGQTTLLLRSLAEAAGADCLRPHFDRLLAMVRMLERDG
jgi:hypothetical protein